MLMQIYSIYDTAVGAYMRPFVSQADGDATRAFSDLIGDAEHPVGRHPEDYSLFRLGGFNDQDGKVIGDGPECLCTGMEMIALKRNSDA